MQFVCSNKWLLIFLCASSLFFLPVQGEISRAIDDFELEKTFPRSNEMPEDEENTSWADENFVLNERTIPDSSSSLENYPEETSARSLRSPYYPPPKTCIKGTPGCGDDSVPGTYEGSSQGGHNAGKASPVEHQKADPGYDVPIAAASLGDTQHQGEYNPAPATLYTHPSLHPVPPIIHSNPLLLPHEPSHYPQPHYQPLYQPHHYQDPYQPHHYQAPYQPHYHPHQVPPTVHHYAPHVPTYYPVHPHPIAPYHKSYPSEHHVQGHGTHYGESQTSEGCSEPHHQGAEYGNKDEYESRAKSANYPSTSGQNYPHSNIFKPDYVSGQLPYPNTIPSYQQSHHAPTYTNPNPIYPNSQSALSFKLGPYPSTDQSYSYPLTLDCQLKPIYSANYPASPYPLFQLFLKPPKNYPQPNYNDDYTNNKTRSSLDVVNTKPGDMKHTKSNSDEPQPARSANGMGSMEEDKDSFPATLPEKVPSRTVSNGSAADPVRLRVLMLPVEEETLQPSADSSSQTQSETTQPDVNNDVLATRDSPPGTARDGIEPGLQEANGDGGLMQAQDDGGNRRYEPGPGPHRVTDTSYAASPQYPVPNSYSNYMGPPLYTHYMPAPLYRKQSYISVTG